MVFGLTEVPVNSLSFRSVSGGAFALTLFYLGVAMAISEPKYSVEVKNDNYEIRLYEKTIVAQTLIADEFDEVGNKAFRILADYIFGNNKGAGKIAMTAPVVQQPVPESSEKTAPSEKIEMTAPVSQVRSSSGYLVQFTMPAKYSMETLPQPNDPRVQIVEIPIRRVAVFSYSGSWSETKYKNNLAEFQTLLEKDSIKTSGEPIFARFDSPFRLWFLRRNEIWLEVVR
jgi:hypothetical protein